jgi:hypothetical protein
LNRFNRRLIYLFYGEKYALLTMIALVCLTSSAYLILSSWDGFAVDYFLSKTFIDLNLAPYLLNVQLIYHAYLAGLSILFFRDMKIWAWIIPWSASFTLAMIYGILMSLSALLFLSINHLLSRQLNEIMPILEYSKNGMGLALYTSLLYSLVVIVFKPIGVIVFYITIALILLYPLEATDLKALVFKTALLYDHQLDLNLTLNQVTGMMMLWGGGIWIRFKKTPLF